MMTLYTFAKSIAYNYKNIKAAVYNKIQLKMIFKLSYNFDFILYNLQTFFCYIVLKFGFLVFLFNDVS
jgi:hypothetical protein